MVKQNFQEVAGVRNDTCNDCPRGDDTWNCQLPRKFRYSTTITSFHHPAIFVLEMFLLTACCRPPPLWPLFAHSSQRRRPSKKTGGEPSSFPTLCASLPFLEWVERALVAVENALSIFQISARPFLMWGTPIQMRRKKEGLLARTRETIGTGTPKRRKKEGDQRETCIDSF